jgi:uncharacterized protein
MSETILKPAHLEVRGLHFRASQEAEAREVTGIAVPWDEQIQIREWFDTCTESVQRGAVEPYDNPKLFWEHRSAIGKITGWRDTDDGWEITAVISRTAQGDEAYELLRDGVIDRFSIGFTPIEHIERTDDDGTVHRIHTKIRVGEVSLVPFPAYDSAKVAAVRSAEKDPTMPEENATPTITRADLTDLRADVDETNRLVKVLQANRGENDTSNISQFRSYGDYVKAVVSGDERAKRAFDGAVSGDGILADQWIGDIVQLQSQAQPVLNSFSKGTLPPQGLTVEWGLLESDTTDFDRQLAEGDDLVFGKVAVTTANAPVYTAGGYSSLSVQAIERTTNINLLDTTWTALALKAARYIERLARKTTLDAVAAQTTLGEVLTADITTARGIIEMVIDLTEHYDDLDLSLTGLMVSKDVFLELYDVEEFESILQVSGATPDKLGQMTISVPDADLAGLSVKLFPKAGTGTIFAYAKNAIKTLEAPGAPLRLTNEVSVIDLTKPLGMYTYVSSFAQQPAGLVPIVAAE